MTFIFRRAWAMSQAMGSKGWIGVDLDGTLAHYDGWKGPTHIGAPVPAMLERVKRWLEEGRDVRIFTARLGTNDAAERVEVGDAIKQWCLEHVGVALGVTNVKDFGMIELWDDRAVQVQPNTGKPYGPSTRDLEAAGYVGVFCTDCGYRLTKEEMESKAPITACPACGSDGVPCSMRDQVFVSVNWHELRVLSIWAENHQRANNLGRTVYGIVKRIEEQHPERADRCPLTLAGELGQISKHFGEISVSSPALRRDIAEQTGEETGLLLLPPDTSAEPTGAAE